MAHVAKYSKCQTGQLCQHYERKQDEKGNYIKFGNENIDLNKTHLNYNLAPNHNNQIEFIQKRTSEVKCLKRKDVNVMCSWVVTEPKDLPKSLEENFFKSTYKFLEDRYKKENVISSYVHLDEATPHMHFAFIPVIRDKKKDIEKVSAKEVITKKDLLTFHKDLEKYLEQSLGKKINVLNEVTREGNKSIDELKRESAIAQLKKVNKKASIIVSKANNEIKSIKDSLTPLKAEYEAKKAFIRQAEKDSDVSVMYPNYAEVKKKGLFSKEEFVIVPKDKWEKKHVARNHVNAVNKEREALEKTLEDITSIQELNSKIRDLERTIKEKDIKIKSIEYTIKSSSELNEAYNKQSKQLREQQQQKQKTRFKNMDWER